jgi:hypothetical protein
MPHRAPGSLLEQGSNPAGIQSCSSRIAPPVPYWNKVRFQPEAAGQSRWNLKLFQPDRTPGSLLEQGPVPYWNSIRFFMGKADTVFPFPSKCAITEQ